MTAGFGDGWMSDGRDDEEAGRAGRRPGVPVTLADVARLAGVSPITASRAINTPDKVAKKRLQAVLAAVEQLGYVPNVAAGSLHTRRSRLVAAIVPSIRTSMFAETVEAFSTRLREKGYEVLLGLSGFDATPDHEEALVAAVLGRKPDALILTGIDHTRRCRQLLMRAGIPVIETWDLTPTPIDMAIGFSHDDVGRAVARHFRAIGRSRPAVIAAVDDRARRRRRGFVGVWTDAAIPVVEIEAAAPGTLRAGRDALAALAREGALPDCIFCSSDPLAEGVLIEARRLGIEVPTTVSVFGFGDLESSADLEPGLSTVRLDRHLLGTTAAEAVLAEIDGRSLPERVIDIGFDLIVRGSS